MYSWQTERDERESSSLQNLPGQSNQKRKEEQNIRGHTSTMDKSTH